MMDAAGRGAEAWPTDAVPPACHDGAFAAYLVHIGWQTSPIDGAVQQTPEERRLVDWAHRWLAEFGSSAEALRSLPDSVLALLADAPPDEEDPPLLVQRIGVFLFLGTHPRTRWVDRRRGWFEVPATLPLPEVRAAADCFWMGVKLEHARRQGVLSYTWRGTMFRLPGSFNIRPPRKEA